MSCHNQCWQKMLMPTFVLGYSIVKWDDHFFFAGFVPNKCYWEIKLLIIKAGLVQTQRTNKNKPQGIKYLAIAIGNQVHYYQPTVCFHCMSNNQHYNVHLKTALLILKNQIGANFTDICLTRQRATNCRLPWSNRFLLSS